MIPIFLNLERIKHHDVMEVMFSSQGYIKIRFGYGYGDSLLTIPTNLRLDMLSRLHLLLWIEDERVAH